MKFENMFAYTIPVFVTVMVLVMISTMFIDLGNDFIDKKDRYVQEQIKQKELQYCARFGMGSIDYIQTRHSLFSSYETNSVKCVNDNGEKLIDYDDDVFCELQIKSKWKKC